MSLDILLSLIGFAFAMSITPGPGNFLLLASGVNFGFRQSLPLVFGISFGIQTLVIFVGLGLGQVLQTYPFIYNGLRLASVIFVFWLAWKIGRPASFSKGKIKESKKPIPFLQAIFLLFLNPKAWAIAVILTASFTNPENYFSSMVLMMVVFWLVNLPSISVWALSGVYLRRFLAEGRKVVIFNFAMAALLVVSMIPVLLGVF